MRSSKVNRQVKEQLLELARALAGPCSTRLERATVLQRIADTADWLARAEVTAARDHDRASWADVGEAFGVTRQTAHERYRSGPNGGASRLTYDKRG